MTLEARVVGVSVWGPGLEGWDASRAVLAGAALYEPRPSPPPVPSMLPPTERRRTGPVVRLALAVAHGAALSSGLPADGLRSVFGSGNGDGVVVGGVLDALARGGPEERLVSPTAFHNSVHNAAAGYWSIAMGSRQPATCLGGLDDTWPAALLLAMVDVVAEEAPVLLCCYDHPLPPPLDVRRPTVAAYGAGLVLAPMGMGPAMAVLRVRYVAGPIEGAEVGGWLPLPALQALAEGNAVARSLRLLQALAGETADAHAVPYLDGRLEIEVSPC